MVREPSLITETPAVKSWLEKAYQSLPRMADLIARMQTQRFPD
jgi:hypothetical protein